MKIQNKKLNFEYILWQTQKDIPVIKVSLRHVDTLDHCQSVFFHTRVSEKMSCKQLSVAHLRAAAVMENQNFFSKGNSTSY